VKRRGQLPLDLGAWEPDLSERPGACFLIVPVHRSFVDVHATTDAAVNELAERGEVAMPRFHRFERARGKVLDEILARRPAWLVYRACAMFRLEGWCVDAVEIALVRARA